MAPGPTKIEGAKEREGYLGNQRGKSVRVTRGVFRERTRENRLSLSLSCFDSPFVCVYMYIYSRAFSSSSSCFTDSFLAKSSTVSERGDRLPNGGRAVRRHDDGDENERRRCCGHSEHAARTFGAFVDEENEEGKEKEKGETKGEERRIKGWEREREKGKEERSETTISDAYGSGDHVHPAVLPAHARSATRLVSQHETHICIFIYTGECVFCVCTCARVYVCVCVHVRRIHAPYLRTAAPRTRDGSGRAPIHLPRATRCDWSA